MADTRTQFTDEIPSPAAPGDSPTSDSLGQLFSKLTGDISMLVRKEVELLKLELTDEAKKAGKGAGMFGGAGGAGFFALLFLSLAFMFALASFMPIGWSALIVGVLYGAVALFLYLQGKKELNSFDPTPHQTVETLKEDAKWARTLRQ